MADATPSSLVYFEGKWSAPERKTVETAAETAERAGLPSSVDVLGAPWVATRNVLRSTRLYMASRQQSESALMDRSAEGLADRIRRFAQEKGTSSPFPNADTASTPLFRLMYESTATRAMTDAKLWKLLQQARSNNEARGITGLLLYASGHFLQVLEGPEPMVRRLFDTIQDDPRHTNIETLLATSTTERTFPDWKMGLEHPRAATDLEGVSSYLQTGTLPDAAEPVTAVLEALRQFNQRLTDN